MKCRDARRALERRIDERLALEVGFELDAHLERCAACRERLQRGDALGEALARMPEPPLERIDVEHSVSAIRARVEAARGAAAPASRRRAPLVTWAAVAAAASLALALVWSERGSDSSQNGAGGPSPAVAGQALENDATGVASATGVATSSATDAPTNTTTPAPVRSPSDPGAVTSGATATETTAPRNPNPVDAQRLGRARGEVRGRLLAAAEGLGPSPRLEDLTAFVRRFDESTADLRSEDWPVLRLVEGALHDDDANIAVLAARYLGRRGDRATWPRLENALEREDLQFVVVDAFADAGEAGFDGLASALRRPDLREAALLALSDAGSEAAARCIADQLARERAAAGEVALLEAPSRNAESQETPAPRAPAQSDLLEALVGFDDHAVGVLLALGEDGALPFEELLGALERMPAAPEWLADALDEAPRARDPEMLVRCATQLQPEAAAEWLLDHARDRRHAALVRSELPRVAGEAGVAALIVLAEDQRTSSDTLDALVGQSLEFDAERFATHAEQLPVLHQVVLAELLIGAEDPLAVHGLRVLAQGVQMPEELRRDVLLAIGEVGDETDVELLLALFADLREHERLLAASGLVALHALGGDPAVQRALEGAEERDLRNLLGLLRRRKAGSGTTSSIYKLARGLRPFLSARDRATQDSSS